MADLISRAEDEKPCKTCGYYNLECPKDCEYGRPSAEAVCEDTLVDDKVQEVCK